MNYVKRTSPEITGVLSVADSDIAYCHGLITRQLPAFTLLEARLIGDGGQFNHVLCINERWIFRFPKSPPAAAELDHELALLPRLRGRLPIRIPEPKYAVRDGGSGLLLFMGYPMLPGEPLLRGKFAAMQDDEDTAARIAHDLAYFLRALHRIPPAAIGLPATATDARAEWRGIYADVRERLFPQMRVEARRAVRGNFEAALNDDDMWGISTPASSMATSARATFFTKTGASAASSIGASARLAIRRKTWAPCSRVMARHLSLVSARIIRRWLIAWRVPVSIAGTTL